MISLSSSCHSLVPPKVVRPPLLRQTLFSRLMEQRPIYNFNSVCTENFDRRATKAEKMLQTDWSFIRGSGFLPRREFTRFVPYKKVFRPSASWMSSTQIAINAFTLGTAAVLPFYALMVLAPKAEMTKRSIESSIPYIVLGVLYAYLLYLSWTPDTLRLMFASKYWLPELPGIAKMFSSEMTLASAWIHLLAVDLFAARQIFHDGIKNEIETRHSVSLCLLFCPIGIVTHFLTKILTGGSQNIK